MKKTQNKPRMHRKDTTDWSYIEGVLLISLILNGPQGLK